MARAAAEETARAVGAATADQTIADALMIVLVTLAVDPETGKVDPGGPFLVTPPPLLPACLYEDEPQVMAQMLPGERQARFKADWIDGAWRFGKRVRDA